MKTDFTTREILLCLNASPQIGSRTFQALAKASGDDFTTLWLMGNNKLEAILPAEIIKKFVDAREKYSPDNELKKLRLIKADYITIFDDDYPPLLREIYDPPFVLYFKGNRNLFSSRTIAIVGSRKFTSYGKSIGHKLAFDLAKSGLTIASGLALGLDSVVQQAALDANGATIGVLACGIDQVYPTSNKYFADRIISNHGLIISEQPPGTPALKQHFPARNRIISGLAEGTLVVEAATASGSLITAAAALEQNREVFAVPGNIDSTNSQGTNNLIKLGARLITSADDVLAALNIEPLNHQPNKQISLSQQEQEIVDLLKENPLHIDKLCQTSKLDIVSVSEMLTLLEIKGAISHIGGGMYKINIL